MADHLCVLVHGYAFPVILINLTLTHTSLWGNPNHLRNVAKVLREKYSEDKLHILVSKRNSGSFTYDGIELGGQRVCQEIEEELKRLSESGQAVKKLSMVGYSLGGLVGRYTVGLLESRGFFDHIEAIVIMKSSEFKSSDLLTKLSELHHHGDTPSWGKISKPGCDQSYL